jgi:hypothetical protein
MVDADDLRPALLPTGSLILPLKALLMNVLMLGAAFGLLVLIFQGALEATQPVLLFAPVVRALDRYAVFLLSPIKEARDGRLVNTQAVAVGLERKPLFCVAIGASRRRKSSSLRSSGWGPRSQRSTGYSRRERCSSGCGAGWGWPSVRPTWRR